MNYEHLNVEVLMICARKDATTPLEKALEKALTDAYWDRYHEGYDKGYDQGYEDKCDELD